MINQLDYMLNDAGLCVTISLRGFFPGASTIWGKSATRNCRVTSQVTRRPEVASSGKQTVLRGLAGKGVNCACGRLHYWGGPVCGECFAFAPEEVQADYLVGTGCQREAAKRALVEVSQLRAAGAMIRFDAEALAAA